MKIYEHKSYEEYVESQTKVNKSKIKWVYAKEHAIKKICEHKKEASFIICHGTRNGGEMRFFLKHFPNTYIIGSEISDTADQFENTIQHDFSMPREEWIGKADIVYSNSFDHSNDPKKTIETWRDQLNETGSIYLEYNEGQSVCEPADCLDATETEVKELVENSGLTIVDRFIGSQGSAVLVCKRSS